MAAPQESALLLFLPFLLLTLLSGDANAEPIPPPSVNSAPTLVWGGLRANDQLQMLLSQMEEQMRNLKYGSEANINQLMRKVETLDSKIGRLHGCDANMDQLLRKLESLDSKLTRLDTSNVHRLDELSGNVHSKAIKQELAIEELARKVDANYERLKHKVTYMESRLDTTLNKMQVNYETGISRLESRHGDIESELADIASSMDDIKSLTAYIDDKHNSTQRTVHEQLQQVIKAESASRQQIEKLSGSIQDLGSKMNESAIVSAAGSQNDGATQSGRDEAERAVAGISMQISNESRRIENKMSNMYNDLWRRFVSLESTVKTVLTLGNTTRRQLQDDFRSFLQMEKHYMEPDSQENFVQVAVDALTNIISELKDQSGTLDNNFQMVMDTQNLLMDKYHRVHNEGLDELESKVSLVLEKIISTVTNKTTRVDNRLVEVMGIIKSAQTEVMRNLRHTTNMIIELSEDNKEGTKHLESGILELAETSKFLTLGVQELYEELQAFTNITGDPANYDETHSPWDETRYGQNDSVPEPVTNSSTPAKGEHEKLSARKHIKFADADDVIRIFTEDENPDEPMNAPLVEKRGAKVNGSKKISIIIPYTFNSRELFKSVNNYISRQPYRGRSHEGGEQYDIQQPLDMCGRPVQSLCDRGLSASQPEAGMKNGPGDSPEPLLPGASNQTADTVKPPNELESIPRGAVTSNTPASSEAPADSQPNTTDPGAKEASAVQTQEATDEHRADPFELPPPLRAERNGSVLHTKRAEKVNNFKRLFQEYKNSKMRRLARVRELEAEPRDADVFAAMDAENQNDEQKDEYPQSNEQTGTDTDTRDDKSVLETLTKAEFPSLEGSGVWPDKDESSDYIE